MTIQTLIDKNDNFEVIRDQIAAILTLETAAQKALATAGGKNPALWDLKIYTERSNPWEKWLNDQDDPAPIVNVWFDSATYDEAGSNVTERQKTEGVFNIDCYALGIAHDVPAGGHKAGDREAAFEAQRAVRLVRNILMADRYTYLGLRGLVWQRWPQSVQVFQPASENAIAQRIVAARLAFRVRFNEFAPQYVAQIMELLSVSVKRAEDGQIVILASY